MSQPIEMKNESPATKPLLQAIDLKNTIRSKKDYLPRSGWLKRWMVFRSLWSAAKRWRWWGSPVVVNPPWAAY